MGSLASRTTPQRHQHRPVLALVNHSRTRRSRRQADSALVRFLELPATRDRADLFALTGTTPAATQTPGTSLFGASNTTQQPSTGGLFGQPANNAAKPSLFGQPAQSGTSGSLFGGGEHSAAPGFGHELMQIPPQDSGPITPRSSSQATPPLIHLVPPQPVPVSSASLNRTNSRRNSLRRASLAAASVPRRTSRLRAVCLAPRQHPSSQPQAAVSRSVTLGSSNSSSSSRVASLADPPTSRTRRHPPALAQVRPATACSAHPSLPAGSLAGV